MNGSYFYQNFELEVNCGNYEAEVTWEVKIINFAIFEPISTFSTPVDLGLVAPTFDL